MSTADNFDPDAEFAQDKQIKKILLINHLTQKCASSDHVISQEINAALNEGNVLQATILSGGYTNFSYKVSVTNHPQLCIFAKLCFERALWNPDKTAHYDLIRTDNEYHIMEIMATKTPESVVAPLACWGVTHNGEEMKLLVTAWSSADEQFCNQFIDGEVDPRIAPKLADTLAELHTIKDYEPNFNEQVKPCMVSLFDQMKEYVQEACDTTTPKDRTETYLVVTGKDVMMKVINANIADYHTRDCLIHGDSHVFNIMVEGKPSIEKLEAFGPNGTVVLCDWEMTMAGAKGHDLGRAISFPVGCMVSHALSGHTEANVSINKYILSLLDSYSARMDEVGRTREEIASIVRNAAGWTGWMLFLVFYYLDIQTDVMPVDNEEDRKFLHDSMGVLGLKLLRFGYDTNYFQEGASTEQVRKEFMALIDDEVTETAFARYVSQKTRKQPRKMSMLRSGNRRISDAAMNFMAADAVARLSIRELSVRNLSIGESIGE